jgi:hypothetical protein
MCYEQIPLCVDMSMSFTISNPESPCDKSALTVLDAETNAINDMSVPLSILGNDTAQTVTGELEDGVTETRIIKDASGRGGESDCSVIVFTR